MLVPALAFAHLERSSYWPDPAPDTSISPAAGGAVPTARPLSTALDNSKPGKTRIVCKGNSISLLKTDIKRAHSHGYNIRPHDHRRFTRTQGKKLLRFNEKLKKRCHFSEIQTAVTHSHNNDRVVVMPGVYTEPTARSKPTQDPSCAQYKILRENGATGAVSYGYQLHCPNDQNLIAVLGRGAGSGTDPQPPLEDRHVIPNAGPCIRCNLQLEGSGTSADDVVVEGGNPKDGNGAPEGGVKDVGIRVDRADGFVLRGMTVRHVNEHAIYVLETDGYLLDRFKTFYAQEYGVLTFVEDHGLMQNCEAAGSGDSGLYPGAGADTGDQSIEKDEDGNQIKRYSQEIRFCDSHHNAGGYSGTDGNATHIDHNNFYDNALGFTTDVFTAPGHPGFPQDSDLIEDNNFYSNNFNPYLPGSDVDPSVPLPVGTGLWIAGGNHNIFRNNHVWNNWRRGTMLFAVPDVLVCGPDPIGTPVTGCDATKFSTSYNNNFHDNVMGVAPDGSKQPNGTDFWWDSFLGNTGNCWHDNTGSDGTAGSVTSSPPGPLLPDCKTLPSIGITYAPNEVELLGCFAALAGSGYDPTTCPWFTTPAKPATPAARTAQRQQQTADRALADDPAKLRRACEVYGDGGQQACDRWRRSETSP